MTADLDLPDGLVEQVSKALRETATGLHAAVREQVLAEAAHEVRWERRENRLLKHLLYRRETQIADNRVLIGTLEATIADLTRQLDARKLNPERWSKAGV